MARSVKLGGRIEITNPHNDNNWAKGRRLLIRGKSNVTGEWKYYCTEDLLSTHGIYLSRDEFKVIQNNPHGR